MFHVLPCKHPQVKKALVKKLLLVREMGWRSLIIALMKKNRKKKKHYLAILQIIKKKQFTSKTFFSILIHIVSDFVPPIMCYTDTVCR